MIGPGSINAWKCPECDGLTVAVHVDAGVTPMFLRCRFTEGCRGMAVSQMYPAPPVPGWIMLLLDWEWYKPTAAETAKLNHEMREHIERGGLDIRPLSAAGRALLDPPPK